MRCSASLFSLALLAAVSSSVQAVEFSLQDVDSSTIATAAAEQDAEAPTDEPEPIDDSGSSVDCCDLCCGPSWTFRAGFVYMTRDGNNDLPLVTVGGVQRLNASDFDFDYEPGLDVSVGRSCGCNGFEVRYLDLSSFEDNITLPVAGGATVRYLTNPVTTFTSIAIANAIHYESDLATIEGNLTRQLNDCTTLLAGFRYVTLDEQFAINTDAWQTKNDLYGFQLGANSQVWNNGCGLGLEAFGKAGVYYNDAEARFTTPFFARGNSTSSDSNTAFLGELGVAATYQLTCNLSLRAGYQALWLEGVALATDQVPHTGNLFTNPTPLDAHVGDGVFLHGANVGVVFVR